MKCLICGSVNSPSRNVCSDCNSPLPRDRKRQNLQVENPTGQESREVPEWRREVSAKARAYGERKKRLTTPPHALNHSESTSASAGEWKETGQKELPATESLPRKDLRPAESRDLPPQISRSTAPARPPVTPTPAPSTSSHPLEVWSEGLKTAATEPDHEETGTAPSLFFLRRAMAFTIDSIMLIVVLAGLMVILSWTTGESYGSFVVSGWRVWVPLALFCHFLYYLYFYTTSRQTPGLVFVSLEIRDPSSSDIPVFRILLRWAALVLFNVLNLIPALAGRKSLLLDDLSGTCVRSMK